MTDRAERAGADRDTSEDDRAEPRRPHPDGDGDRPLRIALLAYRGNPYSGGQGVYVRHLSRELVRLGHHVEVLAGPPYPELDPGVDFTPLPSLDLYREPDPFRTPHLSEFRDLVDVLELGAMWTAAFPEPLTFSLRALRHLRTRRGAFDVVHDNQCLGYGLLGLPAAGFPTLATVHHPVTVDRDIELAQATIRRRVTLRRWYAFTRMQRRVAVRLPEIVTVSGTSRREIMQHLGVPAGRISIVPVGADTDGFRPDPTVPRVPGRIVTTASADVPLKGLTYLLEAVAKLQAERNVELVVVGKARAGSGVAAAVDRYGLARSVRFVSGLSDLELVDLLRSAEAACVPSLYEGFSLPAVEAMSCGTPLVATTGGAIPEVAGTDGRTAVLVPPGDAGALAEALRRVLDDPDLAARLSVAGRQRVLERFTWRATAVGTVERYRALLRLAADPLRLDVAPGPRPVLPKPR